MQLGKADRTALQPVPSDAMSMRPFREHIEADDDRRREVIAYVLEHEPDSDALLKLRYWSDLAELANDKLLDAGDAAREAGHSWAVVGLGYGERSASAALRKFSRRHKA